MAKGFSIENNFTGGLKTEFSGLNFPENACTDTSNCTFSHSGVVSRRLGIDFEEHASTHAVSRLNVAVTSYIWNNADGGGLVHLMVKQVGTVLYFYDITAATNPLPLSNHLLPSTVYLGSFSPVGFPSSYESYECQFATGNGYLFVFHPYLEPFYCSYDSGTITGTGVIIKTRDFVGIEEAGVADSNRPATLTSAHNYNLTNQGWGEAWVGTSVTSVAIPTTFPTTVTVTTDVSLPIDIGDRVRIFANLPKGYTQFFMLGYVTAYSSVSGALSISVDTATGAATLANWFVVSEPGSIVQWFNSLGNYPSNSDVWWNFKNSTDVFDPITTIAHVSVSEGPAPKGHYILDAFNQERNTVSHISGLTVTTSNGLRPKTGAWFAGRVWYAGVDYKGFNESLYFSQIIEKPTQFGKCYQVNDPTSEERFDLLPSDGGVVKIPGTGSVYKLFTIQNGLLVFAANGIWFITGSQGIGFTANDYTIVKVSEVKSISGIPFVSVQGYPFWWNEEDIYSLSPDKSGERAGGFDIKALTIGTIRSFYNTIPLCSKRFARGSYNPLTTVIQWVYKSTEETNTTNRYNFDSILNLNLTLQAFYPWTISSGSQSSRFLHDAKYVASTGIAGSPSGRFKYLYSAGNQVFSFADEHDTDYIDWGSYVDAASFTSYFVTGYKLHGQALRKFQTPYVYVFFDQPTAYKIQGIWNYAISGNSGKYSSIQLFENTSDVFNRGFNKIRIRGNGNVLQFKVISVDGEPFDINGWGLYETQNASI